MPELSIQRKNCANRSVSLFEAESKSVTGLSVKKTVNIEPTRLIVTGTPAL